jgi:branched-chain amino acid transport system ATP-binding protein
MLEIHDLSVSYRGLAALRGVSLTVEEGQFVAIVGPNGAGKTTLFKAISGTVQPASGKIAFEGRDLLEYRRRSARISALPIRVRGGRSSPR